MFPGILEQAFDPALYRLCARNVRGNASFFGRDDPASYRTYHRGAACGKPAIESIAFADADCEHGRAPRIRRRGRRLIDFGMRRAHSAEAVIHAPRAAFLAGFDATATVEAGRRFGIPLSGTMAHS